ncbi:unnamed protein product [Spirodela intermedia]|uniref:Uncharacterized protein n=1 Tax=Spirodela intermedia TaxID=51605 RepID=A0A7I8JDJ0_SPIIN|nr:unnamed protein product [Spirodela intermedia]CAA6667573.1 unnamed protein product [Spirodela intermedia]
MISGARYSCVPTNEFDRASVGSATSCGSAADPPASSTFFLPPGVEAAAEGPKQETWTHEGWRQRGSTQLEDSAQEGRAHRAPKGQVKVREHDVAVFSHQNVLRFQIAGSFWHPSLVSLERNVSPSLQVTE